jgi:hypothetical protein
MAAELPNDWTDKDQDDLEREQSSWDDHQFREALIDDSYDQRLKEGFALLQSNSSTLLTFDLTPS